VHVPTNVSPATAQHLPPVIHALYVGAVAAALHPVFLAAAAVMVGAFALSWRLRDVPLRENAGAADVGESFALPRKAGSEEELERVPAPSSVATPPISSRTHRRARSGAGAAGLPQQS
jgi:hypothetical protein